MLNVKSNGRIYSVAGGHGFCSQATEDCGDGGPALDATLVDMFPGEGGLALGPNGDLHIGDGCFVRAISSVLDPPPKSFAPGNGGGTVQLPSNKYVPSKDGSEVFLFDQNGRHLKTLDRTTGRTLYEFEYTLGGKLERVIQSAPTTGEQSTPLETVINRDASHQPESIVAPFGQTTNFTLDGNGYLGTVSVPGDGDYVATYHDAKGLLQTFQNPRLEQSSYLFDSIGRIQTATDRSQEQLGFSRVGDANGYMVTHTSPMQRPTTYAVVDGDWGAIVQQNNFPDGTTTRVETSLSGRSKITLRDNTFIQHDKVPDPVYGMKDPFTYRSYVRLPDQSSLTVTRSRDVTTDPSTKTVVEQRDTATLNGKTTLRVFDANARTLTTTSPEQRQVVVTYDNNDMPSVFQRDDYASITLTYDRGRVATIQHGTRQPILIDYDDDNGDGDAADGYVRTVTRNDGTMDLVTTYQHDPMGRVTEQSLPNQSTSSLGRVAMSYDGTGALSLLTPPGYTTPPASDSVSHGFATNPLGLLQSYEPPPVSGVANKDTTYHFNADRQLDYVEIGNRIIDWKYNETPAPGTGRIESVELPGTEGEIFFTFDPQQHYVSDLVGPATQRVTMSRNGGLLESLSWSQDISGGVSWTRDADFRIETETVTSGSTVSYLYDDDGLPLCVGACSWASGSVTVGGNAMQVFWDDTEHEVETWAGNNPSNSWSTVPYVHNSVQLNDYQETETLTSTFVDSGTTTSLHSESLVRDDLGRITSKTETTRDLDGTTDTVVFGYAYDTNGRLWKVWKDSVLEATYTYTDNGNRLNDGSLATDAIYDDQDRLNTYGDNTYSYNDAGQLEEKEDTGASETTTYTYDALGNLRSVTLPDARVITYSVDGVGRRVGKRIDGTPVQGLIYRSGLQPVAQLEGSGGISAQFVYASSRNVPDYALRGGTLYRIITDHLGSLRLVVDTSDGSIMQRMDYDAWGRVTVDEKASGWEPLVFGFAGGIYDRDTELVRFGARDYDAEVGRWTSKDPILFGGGDTLLYGYVGGDPVNRVDSLGLWVIGIGYQAQAGAGVVAASAGVEFNLGLYIEFNTATPGISLYASVGGALASFATPRSVVVPGAILGAMAGYGPVFTLGFGTRNDLKGFGLEGAIDSELGGIACMIGSTGDVVGINVSPAANPPVAASKGGTLHVYPTYTVQYP